MPILVKSEILISKLQRFWNLGIQGFWNYRAKILLSARFS